MEQSQLIELIKTLNPKEKEQILQFATLQFFPRSKMKSYVLPLLHLCLKHPWQDPEKRLEKKDVQAALFQGQAFVEGKLEKVMVEADKVIRSFLLTQHYFREENEFHQVFDFAEIIRVRGLDLRYRSLLGRLRKIQEEAQSHNTLYFHHQYLLEYAVHNEASLYNQIKGDLNIPPTLDALEMHFYLNQLALLNVYLLQQKAANINIPPSMEVRLEDTKVPVRYIESSPTIRINYAIFRLLKKDVLEAEDAKVLFDMLITHEHNIDDQTIKGFYTYLRNICVLILNVNPENEAITTTLFELYKDNLERGYLHYEGKLLPSRYLAISEYAARAEKHEWALAFIEKYKHEIIGENESQDIYRLNLAYYLFGTGQYEACLDHIPATSPYVNYLFAGKRLELKALYESQSGLLSYKMDAFKMFLSRTSQKLLPGKRRQINIDFLNLFFQLVATPQSDPKRVTRLIEHISEKKQAAEYHWLLAKATHLKSRGH